MTSKEFVEKKYSKSYAQKIEWGAGLEKSLRTSYYLILSNPIEKIRLGEGDTESKAWKNAKENIIEEQKQ